MVVWQVWSGDTYEASEGVDGHIRSFADMEKAFTFAEGVKAGSGSLTWVVLVPFYTGTGTYGKSFRVGVDKLPLPW